MTFVNGISLFTVFSSINPILCVHRLYSVSLYSRNIVYIIHIFQLTKLTISHPVRSSRRDQIHSSIVSTLLALWCLMDAVKLSSLVQQIVLIHSIRHCVDRADSIESSNFRCQISTFLLTITSIIIFRLDRTARRSILSIHTSSWGDDSRLSADVLDWLIEQTSGYCAVLKVCVCRFLIDIPSSCIWGIMHRSRTDRIASWISANLFEQR